MPLDDLLGPTQPRRSPFRAVGRRRIFIMAVGAVGLVLIGAAAGVGITGSHGGGARSLPTLTRPTIRETTTITTIKRKRKPKPKPVVTVPPPTAPPATAPPATFPPVTSPPPTAAPVVCPTGSPVVAVTAVYHHPDPSGPPFVDYSASGTITNRGTGPIVPGPVFVYFNDATGGLTSYLEMFWPTDAAGHDLTPTIPSGATVPWDARWSGPGLDFMMLMAPPAAVVAKLSSWHWGSPFRSGPPDPLWNCLAFGGT